MTENKMAQVAQMFGKKLDEEFRLKTRTGVVLPFLYWFNANGLVEALNGNEAVCSEVLRELLLGEAEIVED